MNEHEEEEQGLQERKAVLMWKYSILGVGAQRSWNKMETKARGGHLSLIDEPQTIPWAFSLERCSLPIIWASQELP